MKKSNENRKENRPKESKMKKYFIITLKCFIITFLLGVILSSFGFLGVFLISSGFFTIHNSYYDERSQKVGRQVYDLNKIKEETELKIGEVVNKYDRLDGKAPQQLSNEIDRYFQDLNNNVPEFAKEITGWSLKLKYSGKWIADKFVPILTSDDERNEAQKYLLEIWNKYFPTEDEIVRDIKQILDKYNYILEANFNKMQVEIEINLDKESRFRNMHIYLDEPAFRRNYNLLLKKELSKTVGISLAGEAISLLGTEVAIQPLLTRIISWATGMIAGQSTVLGTISGSSWMNLGIGIVLAIIVDHGFTKHSENRIKQELIRKFNDLKRYIKFGDDKNPGLVSLAQEELKSYHKARRQAIYQSIIFELF